MTVMIYILNKVLTIMNYQTVVKNFEVLGEISVRVKLRSTIKITSKSHQGDIQIE